ncbi:hypothetical protein ARMSODRAFT_958019 [Armillaria solidipes]|uniref:Uncharacterized protein n=1 Tax=Armillaria solidipes TaxID=1076256 RepID=A0A2H3C0S4_9AGAR|nr:hypothetical protein ARMSODRAFT_958019 [Armillaria solidipes]
MLSLPLVLLSLHALAVYSVPALDNDDVAVLRRGGMIHGLTLRREEYHQLQKRAVSICDVPARDASNSDCTKRYPSNLTKRMGSSKTKTTRSGLNNKQSGSNEKRSSSPSQYSDHPDSSEERQDLQDDQEMEEYENQQAGGNHCDHLVELQTVDAILRQYCTTTPGISTASAEKIRDYLNNPAKNLYLIRGDINLAKGAATKQVFLRARNPDRPLTYDSKFDKPTWIGVVQYLKAKESVAEANAAQIKSDSGLTEDVNTKIHAIYKDALAVAEAMSDKL